MKHGLWEAAAATSGDQATNRQLVRLAGMKKRNWAAMLQFGSWNFMRLMECCEWRKKHTAYEMITDSANSTTESREWKGTIRNCSKKTPNDEAGSHICWNEQWNSLNIDGIIYSIFLLHANYSRTAVLPGCCGAWPYNDGMVASGYKGTQGLAV